MGCPKDEKELRESDPPDQGSVSTTTPEEAEPVAAVKPTRKRYNIRRKLSESPEPERTPHEQHLLDEQFIKYLSNRCDQLRAEVDAGLEREKGLEEEVERMKAELVEVSTSAQGQLVGLGTEWAETEDGRIADPVTKEFITKKKKELEALTSQVASCVEQEKAIRLRDRRLIEERKQHEKRTDLMESRIRYLELELKEALKRV